MTVAKDKEKEKGCKDSSKQVAFMQSFFYKKKLQTYTQNNP